jgi:replicative DNA helicase
MTIDSQKPLLPGGAKLPETLAEQVQGFDKYLYDLPTALFRPIPMPLENLNRAFGGGLHPQDLTLTVGRQNVGKTIFVNQIARHIAIWATENNYPIAPFVCVYEHDAWTMYARLLCMESWHVCPESPLRYEDVIGAIGKVKGDDHLERAVFSRLFDVLPSAALQAQLAISKYAGKLVLYHGSRVYTTVDVIREMLSYYLSVYGLHLIPIIDYWQAMPPSTRFLGKDIEAPDVVRAANLGSLKDLANDWRVPVIAVAAVEKTALARPGPVHLEDVLGPEVSNYTPDCAIVLNRDTVRIASSGNGTGREQTIRVSVEKNRHGPSELEWRHELLGGSFYIHSQGQEASVEESFQVGRVELKKGLIEGDSSPPLRRRSVGVPKKNIIA